MLLRKKMSLLGIGSARINLILDKTNVSRGEKVTGQFVLKGGTVEQHVRRIDCDLMKLDMENDQESVIDTSTILSSRTIKADEEMTLPFLFNIPLTAVASGKTHYYYFKTKLVFNEGVESKDQDYIFIN